jgi:hypothetical protein
MKFIVLLIASLVLGITPKTVAATPKNDFEFNGSKFKIVTLFTAYTSDGKSAAVYSAIPLRASDGNAEVSLALPDIKKALGKSQQLATLKEGAALLFKPYEGRIGPRMIEKILIIEPSGKVFNYVHMGKGGETLINKIKDPVVGLGFQFMSIVGK